MLIHIKGAKWIGWGDNTYGSLFQPVYSAQHSALTLSKLIGTNIVEVYASGDGSYFMALDGTFHYIFKYFILILYM